MQAVIFDMDGVIVDTMDLHWDSSVKTFAEEGLNVTKDELKKFDSMRSTEIYKSFFGSKSKEEVETIISRKYVRLMKKAKGIKPIPGFLEFLHVLKGKVPLAVVSTSRRKFIKFILEEIEELGSFNALIGGEDVSKGKPDPEGYLKAATILGVDPKKCLVIEDSIYGIKSAKNAGMKCIAVTNTYDKNFLLDADLVVDSLAEISFEKAQGLFDA